MSRDSRDANHRTKLVSHGQPASAHVAGAPTLVQLQVRKQVTSGDCNHLIERGDDPSLRHFHEHVDDVEGRQSWLSSGASAPLHVGERDKAAETRRQTVCAGREDGNRFPAHHTSAKQVSIGDLPELLKRIR